MWLFYSLHRQGACVIQYRALLMKVGALKGIYGVMESAALSIEYRALSIEYRALLMNVGALKGIYVVIELGALSFEYRALSIEYRALLIEFRARF